MTLPIFYKLLAIIVAVAIGYAAGRMRWLGKPQDGDPARVLASAAFYIFVPALLFRTMSRLDLVHMPWSMIVTFFVPLVATLLLVYLSQRKSRSRHGAAAPAVRALTACFGNGIQVGVPFMVALFGEGGLALLLALISLHAMTLLSVMTVLVELDIARQNARHATAVPLWRTLLQTARNTLIHPVVLPVVAGLLWNLTGFGLHPVIDESLATVGSGVVPLCLVLIGVTLASYGLQGRLQGALMLASFKLLVLPAVMLVVTHWGFGVSGVPLAVMVLFAAMPTGANALIFAQRYETLPAETTAASVVSTVGFALTAPLWLVVLGWVG